MKNALHSCRSYSAACTIFRPARASRKKEARALDTKASRRLMKSVSTFASARSLIDSMVRAQLQHCKRMTRKL